MPKVVIYTDGGARGNPGPAGAGVVIIDGKKRAELKAYLGVENVVFYRTAVNSR